MDIASIAFALLQFFYSLFQEYEVTKEQCAEMNSTGVAVYPVNQDEYDRIEKCKEISKHD